MKYQAKHQIVGLTPKPVEAGEEFDAKAEDVKHLLAAKHGGELKDEDHAALIPAKEAKKDEDKKVNEK